MRRLALPILLSVLGSLACFVPAQEKAAKAQKEKQEDVEPEPEKPEAPPEKVTRANYNRLAINAGVSLDEVQRVLGPGRETSQGAGLQFVVWQSDGAPRTSINMTFRNGVLISKTITGP